MTSDASRKLGPSDRRYAPVAHKDLPPSLRRRGEDRTDWEGFVLRYFPGSRRHDLDVVAAHESYRNDARGPRAADATVTETERWEGEGGTAPGRTVLQ
jgi:hypothetical protein